MLVVPCVVTVVNRTVEGGASGDTPVVVSMVITGAHATPLQTGVLSTITVVRAVVLLVRFGSTSRVGSPRGFTVETFVTLPGTLGVTVKFTVVDALLAKLATGQVTVVLPPENGLKVQPAVNPVTVLAELAGSTVTVFVTTTPVAVERTGTLSFLTVTAKFTGCVKSTGAGLVWEATKSAVACAVGLVFRVLVLFAPDGSSVLTVMVAVSDRT